MTYQLITIFILFVSVITIGVIMIKDIRKDKKK